MSSHVVRCLRWAGAAAIIGSLVAAGPAAAAADPPPIGPRLDVAANPQALREAPRNYAPYFRWWWPNAELGDDDITTELGAMAAAGFGGAEQVLLGDGPSWFTPAFRDRIKEALVTARATGLGLDVTLGPGWPVTSGAIEPAQSMQALLYSHLDVAGGTSYNGPPPPAPQPSVVGFGDVSPGGNDKLVAVTAARIADVADSGEPLVAKPVMLDPKSAVDLTSKIGNDGQLHWDAPDAGSRWKLFGFWMRPTGQLGMHIPDHFSRDAMETALADFDERVFGGDMAALWAQDAGTTFEDSLEISAGAGSVIYWTPDFLAESSHRRGYDLRPFLPVLFVSGQNDWVAGMGAYGAPDFDFPGGLGSRVRYDYYQTLTDLYIDDHLTPIREWSNAHGLHERAQPAYNQTLDVTRSAAATELPDVETLAAGDPPTAPTPALRTEPGSPASRAVIDRYREVSSGAHLSGSSSVVSSELGAISLHDYELNPSLYKWMADRSFAGGVTRMVVCCFADPDYEHNAWPGWSPIKGRFSEPWNQDFPQMAAWPGLAGYLGRASAASQNGRPRVDLAVYHDDIRSTSAVTISVSNNQPGERFIDGVALERAGFNWDLVDPVSLRTRGAFGNGRLMPDGPAYKALVVDVASSVAPTLRGRMPAATAERVLELARAGLPVVFVGDLPAAGTSFADPAGEDARVKQAVAALAALPNVRRVGTDEELPGALAALGVHPDAALSQPADVVPVHRHTAGGDVWWLWNDSDKPVDLSVQFAASEPPVQIDLWNGTSEPVAQYRETSAGVETPVRLGPGETTLLSFAARRRPGLHVVSTDAQRARSDGRTIWVEDTRPGTRTAQLSDGRNVSATIPDLPAPMQLDHWDLAATTVGPEGETEHHLKLDRLQDWRDIDGLRSESGSSESGTGVYTAKFTLPADWTSTGRGVLLDAGDVGGSLDAFVNGKRVTWQTVPGGQWPIDELVHGGENELRVEVRTNLINKMVALARSGNPDYAQWAARDTQPYGLLGPVRLVPYARSTIATVPKPRRGGRIS